MNFQGTSVPTRATLVACVLGALTAIAQAHDEVVIFRNGAGRLVMHLESADAIPIPTSIFPGINGYATGLVGFHSSELDEPLEDLFALNPASDIRAIFIGADPGIQIYNGLSPMIPGDAMVFGNPPFDFHPIYNIYAGTPGAPYAVRLVFHDVTGTYSDSQEVSLVFTPCNSPVEIASSPPSIDAVIGADASFSVGADGPATGFRWRHDGVDLVDGGRISGSATATLNISDVDAHDQGEYDCVVTGPCNAATSGRAVLAVFCQSDYNRDGFVDPLDYNAFINAFEAGSLEADFNGDTFLDPLDYNGFINAFEAGC